MPERLHLFALLLVLLPWTVPLQAQLATARIGWAWATLPSGR
jgi:hypothetical protein